MVQRNRKDAPGRRHHVFNRGLAKRVILPDHQAKRRFLTLLACAVRRGEINVESFALLDTHFHLLVRSTDVPFSYPLMRVQNAYARYFNRRYERDGSPYRGRFGSVPVLSDAYRLTLVRYIDFNAVRAGLCDRPAAYAYGSARLYTSDKDGPRWLSRTAVESHVCHVSGAAIYRGTDYTRVLGAGFSDAESEVVKRRLLGRVHDQDPLEHVLPWAAPEVADWMRRKAMLADGLSPWAPIVGSLVVRSELRANRRRLGDQTVALGGRPWDAFTLLEAGLLHDAAGMGCEEISREIGVASSTAGRRLRFHREALKTSPEYAALAGEILRAGLDVTYPMGRPQ